MPIIAIYAAIAFFIAASSFASGYKVESWHRDSLDVKAEQLAEFQVKAEADKAAAASAELEKEKQDVQTRTQIITKTVDRIVSRPVYIRQCLDADGLQLAQSALQGTSANPGQPHPALPGAKPAGGRIGSGGAKKAR